jgi:hypothetical protein
MNKANFILLASLALAGCTSTVPIEDLPCPCATGFVCCDLTNQCLAPGEVCAPIDGGVRSKSMGKLGSSCDVLVDAGMSQGVYNASASECPSHLCLKPVVQQGATMPDPLTQATCSQSCSQDSDCNGELRDNSNPLDQRCERGYACGIPFVKGDLCCKKMCMCKDFLAPAGVVTPIACQGDGAKSCDSDTSSPPMSSVAGVGEQTDIYVTIQPNRQLDIVAMIDNSPGMAPKVGKFNASFSKLMDALKDPNDGTLPDLRVAIIDSDLGTDGQYLSGSCGPKILSDGTSMFGDLGRFQMFNSPTCPITPGLQYLERTTSGLVNYTGDISTVFTCLTSNLGTLGCGEGHQLQAFEFALLAGGLGKPNDDQHAMLRSAAYLGLIFLSDEDDCSAATNDGMFGDKPDLLGESVSLRCVTRAHACGGNNLTIAPPGYPTTAAFNHAFSDCQARTDSCPNATDGNGQTDTSVATPCSPLKDLQRLAQEIRGLKADPDNQILVAGIFGWPRTDADMASAQYKIAPVPNPNTADTQHPTVYDYWPVCYDPNHLPSPATTDPTTGFDATAAAWGATGGLRESAFVDQFGKNGLKFSICEPDFTTSMQTIGSAIAKKLQNLCLDYKLVDADLVTPGLQPDCRVAYRVPKTDGSGRIVYDEEAAGLPLCPTGATNGKVSVDCWQLVSDTTTCPASGQLVQVLRTQAEISEGSLIAGTKVGMNCRTCPATLPGAVPVPGCDY